MSPLGNQCSLFVTLYGNMFYRHNLCPMKGQRYRHAGLPVRPPQKWSRNRRDLKNRPVHNIELRLNRILKQLKDEGLIEYAGSKKTGGYRVVKENP